MTGGALGQHVGELQRLVGAFEADVGEAVHYSEDDRARIGAALSDLAVRVELIRLAVLDPASEDGEP